MKIGLMLSVSEDVNGTIENVVENAKAAELEGFSSLWMANIFGLDAITTLAIIGQATKSILLGTAVTPTYPRHPTALAQQALTTGAACQGRFTLGIGLSHQVVIENMLGLSYSKPARHMREYLAVLLPLLRGETVSHQGELYQVNQIKLAMPGQTEVPTLVAALGPVMLKLAGQQAQGTITWMTGPKNSRLFSAASVLRSARGPDPPTAKPPKGERPAPVVSARCSSVLKAPLNA